MTRVDQGGSGCSDSGGSCRGGVAVTREWIKERWGGSDSRVDR